LIAGASIGSLIKCTNPRDRLSVAVLFAAIAVAHVVGFDNAVRTLSIDNFGSTVVGLFVVTWLCAITFWRLGGEPRWQVARQRRQVSERA
jgi:protein-S-isoprenylcysteine O-methyltransferase Ste14